MRLLACDDQPVTRSERAHWIDHRGHRTYEICAKVAQFADSLGIDFRDVEDMMLDDWLADLIPAWQDQSVIHRVAERFITETFMEETGGPYIARTYFDKASGPLPTSSQILTVDHAFAEYGIAVEPFDVPRQDPQLQPIEAGLCASQYNTEVADACYTYFVENVMWSEPYAELVDLMADEVFHTLFADRRVLFAVNAFIAERLRSACLPDAIPDIAGHFTVSRDRLKRRPIPQRIKRAVFYRDRGRCTECGRDLSWVLDSLPAEQFDHVVPLARGGLNDITNLQLLCEPCNKAKADNLTAPRLRYRRWLAWPTPKQSGD